MVHAVGEHEVARTFPGEPQGNGLADATRPAGDEHDRFGPVARQGRRHAQRGLFDDYCAAGRNGGPEVARLEEQHDVVDDEIVGRRNRPSASPRTASMRSVFWSRRTFSCTIRQCASSTPASSGPRRRSGASSGLGPAVRPPNIADAVDLDDAPERDPQRLELEDRRLRSIDVRTRERESPSKAPRMAPLFRSAPRAPACCLRTAGDHSG